MSSPHARIKPGPTQIQADILPIAPLVPQLKKLSSHYSTYLYIQCCNQAYDRAHIQTCMHTGGETETETRTQSPIDLTST